MPATFAKPNSGLEASLEEEEEDFPASHSLVCIHHLSFKRPNEPSSLTCNIAMFIGCL